MERAKCSTKMDLHLSGYWKKEDPLMENLDTQMVTHTRAI